MAVKTKNNFQQIIQSDNLVLVDFYTNWCGPCKMMSPILHDLKEKVGQSLKVLKVDAEKNMNVSKKYQISGVPTLILFRKGNILWRKSGVVPLNSLINIVNQYKNKGV